MRTRMLGTIALIAVLTTASGCATSEEIATWRAHDTHFASGAHAGFSVRNDISSRPEVTRGDLSRAGAEGWWGDPVTVDPDQIVGR
jgi:hypothetical protein